MVETLPPNPWQFLYIRESANSGLTIKSVSLSIIEKKKKKISHNATTLLCLLIAYDYFCSITAKLSSCDRDHMVHEPKIFTIVFFADKVGRPMLYGIAMNCKHKVLILTHAPF